MKQERAAPARLYDAARRLAEGRGAPESLTGNPACPASPGGPCSRELHAMSSSQPEQKAATEPYNHRRIPPRPHHGHAAQTCPGTRPVRGHRSTQPFPTRCTHRASSKPQAKPGRHTPDLPSSPKGYAEKLRRTTAAVQPTGQQEPPYLSKYSSSASRRSSMPPSACTVSGSIAAMAASGRSWHAQPQHAPWAPTCPQTGQDRVGLFPAYTNRSRGTDFSCAIFASFQSSERASLCEVFPPHRVTPNPISRRGRVPWEFSVKRRANSALTESHNCFTSAVFWS